MIIINLWSKIVASTPFVPSPPSIHSHFIKGLLRPLTFLLSRLHSWTRFAYWLRTLAISTSLLSVIWNWVVAKRESFLIQNKPHTLHIDCEPLLSTSLLSLSRGVSLNSIDAKSDNSVIQIVPKNKTPIYIPITYNISQITVWYVSIILEGKSMR